MKPGLAAARRKSTDGGDQPALWRLAVDRMGGVAALVQAVVPTAVFAILTTMAGLFAAAVAAFVVSASLVVWQVVRRRRTRGALIGLAMVTVSLLIALGLGDAKDYYAVGIWSSLGNAVAGLGSVLVRRPLAGYVWGWVLGHGGRWRSTEAAVRAYSWATLIGAAVNVARFAVQGMLYHAGSVDWLAVARMVMGWPLGVASLVAVYPLVRKAAGAVHAAGAGEPRHS
ncbi:DUF3159 domain-containing protein [Mycobacterium talmoniae]|uniref:DUF3159 domain-containing protein n=1 Tax=Mycobacterium talmoniae TaxID=1858794 RepID=A0A1S1NTU8_9MYCO|nr:DUF3159 domain-containing protein [Mycobacterium talmoniae]OHV06660.1 hypothetical protein BKN37_01440 [Mycobacterium talmoniae]